ncbi:adenine phosphoribosyltransferase [Myxococcota bacterium]|nr:adenine phosphoribosyltransferase [Myxococcota bacterium]MBU1535568.1 adenine phosphoribosyltransferase [Myxococcota bacterium]
MTNQEILMAAIRAIPDFPKPGILFRDITTLIADPPAFEIAVNMMVEAAREAGVQKIVAIESRGFIFGAPMAVAMKLPLVIVRKPGKLPGKVVRESYALEYGTDTLEIHEDAVSPDDCVAVVDDLLATGGTAAAVGSLLTKLKARVGLYLFAVELTGLAGTARLLEKIPHAKVVSLVSYE